MKPVDRVLSRTPSPLALQQTPSLDPSASKAQFKALLGLAPLPDVDDQPQPAGRSGAV